MENEIKVQVAYFIQLYENSAEAVAILDNQDKIISINKSFTRIFKYTINEVEGKPINDCIADKRLTKDAFDISRIVLNGGFVSSETLRKSKDGKLLNVKITAFPIVVNNIQVGAYAAYEDTTEQKRLELELKEHQEWFKVTLSSVGDGVIATDNEGKIKFINSVAEDITGYSAGKGIGQDLRKVFNVIFEESDDDINNKVNLLFSKVINDGVTLKSIDGISLISRNGKKYIISGSAAPIRNHRQENIGMVITFQNITDRILMEEKLKKMSLYDSLTDVYNRAYFQEVLVKYNNEKLTNIGMIVCDLDGLKIINDTLGHFSGDELLITAAGILKKLLRRDSLVARIGGDEFAILLKNCSQTDVEELNEEIQNEIERYNSENNKIHLSMATGTAFNGGCYKPIEDIFKEADNNMYVCKLDRKEVNRNSITKTLIKELEERDFGIEGHIERMKKMAIEFSNLLGLTNKIKKSIILLARFHDIGKVGIEDKILKKKDLLSEEERKEIKRHCEIGYRIAKHTSDLESIADLILKHHEFWNGMGYPMSIKGLEIPLECRIISIIDAYEAMTGKRQYKQVMSKDEAIYELKRCSGLQFDPMLVGKFIEYLQMSN